MEHDDNGWRGLHELSQSPRFRELDIDCLAAGIATTDASVVQVNRILHLQGEIHESPQTLQIHCASLIALWGAVRTPSVVDLGDCACVGRRLLLRERNAGRRFAIHALALDSDQALFVVISSVCRWPRVDLAKLLVAELVGRAETLVAHMGSAAGGATPVIESRPEEIWYGFTAREVDILKLIANGMSNKQIARELGSSANTVRNQIHALFRKTGVVNRTELALRVAS